MPPYPTLPGAEHGAPCAPFARGTLESMGDLLSPKRRDVFDRLRRRLDSLRRHQNGTALGRYAQQGSLRGQFEAQHRETLLLHQRWQQSRAAKRNARRDSKAVRDPAAAATAAAANTGPNQPNNLVSDSPDNTTLTQCWLNIGPAWQTLTQHSTNIGKL